MDSDIFNGKRILDIKYGDIDGDGKLEKVVLTGEELYPTSVDLKDLQLVIYESEDVVVTQSIPGAAGRDFELFLLKFTEMNRDEIMIRGQSTDYSYLNVLIYNYEKRSIVEIFNGQKFAMDYNCSAMFKDYYLVELMCPTTNIKHLLSIMNKQERYEGKIYNKEGIVITTEQPRVSFIKEAYPIKRMNLKHYILLVFQEILGPKYGEILGYLQRQIIINGNGEVKGAAHMVAQQGQLIKMPYGLKKRVRS